MYSIKIFKFIMLAISLLGIFSCNKEKEKEVQNLQESFVLSNEMLKTTTTSLAKTQNLQNELSFYGKITTDNNKLIEIFPVVGGNVSKVFVELGDYVQKGQLLATIKSTEVAGFEKELYDAKNELILAQNNLKVAKELYEGKLNTEKDILEAKSELDKSHSQLNRVQETYKIYNIKGGATYEVRSPISGFIIQKNINQAMMLRSDKTDNIFDVAQIDEVWAMANVNETDINQVHLGIDARVSTLSYPDKIFSGKVDKIYNIIDPETKAMKIRIKLNNKDYSLKPEMRANIKLTYNEPQQMLAVDSRAIIFDKSKNFVMIFRDKNNIETREVEVFRQVGNLSFIKSGIKENEKVITQNQMLIYNALND